MAFYIACAIAAAAFSQAEIAAVYQPLLRERYHGTSASQMVVKDTSLPMPTLRGSLTDWLKQFDEVPPALTRAASQLSPKESRRLEASLFPTGTRLVSATAIEAAFRGSGTRGEVVGIPTAVWRARMGRVLRGPCRRRSIERAGLL
jgi:hypothetical protein